MSTEHDKSVLECIFNPLLPLGDNSCELSNAPEQFSAQEEISGNDPVKTAAAQLEVDGINAAENDDIEVAIKLLSQSIDLVPTRASGYNNRAQARRIKGDIEGAEQDLNTAIELSGGQGKVANLAFTQRAMLRQLKGLDDAALADYKKAAALGNQFAKQQTVLLNPMAAMCNKMLTEVIQQLKRGEPTE